MTSAPGSPNPYAPPKAQDPLPTFTGAAPAHAGYVYRPLHGFSWLITAGLVLYVLIDLVHLANARMGFWADDHVMTPLAWFGLRMFAIVIVTIGFCLFLPRANRNARAFGCDALAFTPGWSAGVFFVPIWSFYKPYQAVKELWQASVPEGPWQFAPVSPLLPWWWGMWIAGRVIGRIISPLGAFGSAMSIVAAALCFLVVRGLVDRFEQRAQILSAASSRMAMSGGERG